MADKKQIVYDYKSRRQMWQAYQHLIKTHEYAKECWKQIRKQNQAVKNLLVNNNDLEKYYNNLMVETWVTINGIKKICRKQFNCEIEALEVYK